MRYVDLRDCAVLALMLLVNQGIAQTTWERSSLNPAITAWSGGVDDPSGYRFSLAPAVLREQSGSFYRMWFISLAYGFGTSFSISEAISPDGERWFVNVKNPVLTGTPGTFDERGILNPSILRDSLGYKIYYTGYDNSSKLQIGLATSPDGVQWTKHGAGPVFPGGPSGSWYYSVRQPSVIYDEGIYKMWFDGSNNGGWRIGYATSPDGVTWTMDPASPVLLPGDPGSFDGGGVGEPSVVKVGSRYHMLYSGYTPSVVGRIGYAFSDDGKAWTKDPNPVIGLGKPDSWESNHVAEGSLLFFDGQFHTWYTGGNSGLTNYQIGYAVADSGGTVNIGQGGSLPTKFSLNRNFPNPFNPTTTIEYELPHQAMVRITIYNALGQEVRSLVNKEMPAGQHRVQFDGSPLASGLYVYRLSAVDEMGLRHDDEKKMLLLK